MAQTSLPDEPDTPRSGAVPTGDAAVQVLPFPWLACPIPVPPPTDHRSVALFPQIARRRFTGDRPVAFTSVDCQVEPFHLVANPCESDRRQPTDHTCVLSVPHTP